MRVLLILAVVASMSGCATVKRMVTVVEERPRYIQVPAKVLPSPYPAMPKPRYQEYGADEYRCVPLYSGADITGWALLFPPGLYPLADNELPVGQWWLYTPEEHARMDAIREMKAADLRKVLATDQRLRDSVTANNVDALKALEGDQ